MSYETSMHGEIEIDPPILWRDIRGSVFLPENAVKGTRLNRRDIMFLILERTEDTDDGTLTRKEAVALVPTHSSYAGNIDEHLQEVVDAFPDHEFRGRIDGEGENNTDMWRLKVVNRRATRFEPTLLWPKESE